MNEDKIKEVLNSMPEEAVLSITPAAVLTQCKTQFEDLAFNIVDVTNATKEVKAELRAKLKAIKEAEIEQAKADKLAEKARLKAIKEAEIEQAKADKLAEKARLKAIKEAEIEQAKADKLAEKEQAKAEKEQLKQLELERQNQIEDYISKLTMDLIEEKYSGTKYNTQKGNIIFQNHKMSSDDVNMVVFNVKVIYNGNPLEIDGEKIDVDFNDKNIVKLVSYCISDYANQHPVEQRQLSDKFKDSEAVNWYNGLQFTEEGKVACTLDNTVSLFDESPVFKGKFAYNEFTKIESFEGKEIKDEDISKLRLSCENILGYDNRDKVETAVNIACHNRSFNPFKRKLESLVWDGVERKDTYFIDWVGAENTELNKSMTRKWFYALMKRLYEPGCKFDNILIAYDEKQGTGKSMIVEKFTDALGIGYGYCNNCSCRIEDKDNVDKLNKSWIVGFDELTKVLKADPESAKQFFSTSQDVARLSYARRSETYNRHCVFYGSTNVEFFLKDYTSNFERRYWVMNCKGDDTKGANWWKQNLTDEYIQQVLAEAYYFYKENPQFEYTGLSLEEKAELKKIQRAHKTLNNDEELLYNIEKLLNAKYDVDTFEEPEDLIAAVERCKCYIEPDEISNGFFDTNNSSTKLFTIDRIPTRILKGYLRINFKRDLSAAYISALLGDGWSKKRARYNNRIQDCFVRSE